MKRILSIVLSTMMLVALVPCMTVTAKVYGDFQYEVRDGYVEITKCRNVASVEIPRKIDDLPVTRIDDFAFLYCDRLKSIFIPYGITEIGAGAFEWCESLSNIYISNSVISIGGRAFYDTAYYNNKKNWQDGALYLDGWLLDTDRNTIPVNYDIKYGTRGIADEAFLACSWIEKIVVPEGIVTIGASAFSNCIWLETISLPSSLTNIKGCFAYCTNLSNIYYGGTREQWRALNFGLPDEVNVHCSDGDYIPLLPTPTPHITNYPFVIESLSLETEAGEKITSVPAKSPFVIAIKIKPANFRASQDYLCVAVYDKQQALLYLDYRSDYLFLNNSFEFHVPAQKGDIGFIKAFIWDGFIQNKPLAIPAEI